MFGEIFIQIGSARFTKDILLVLVNYILDPRKMHIHGFGTF